MKVFKGWFGEKPDNFTGIVEEPDGSKRWCLNGLLHKVDGHAVEWYNGNKFWCLNGNYMTEIEHTKRTAWIKTTLGKLIFNEHFKLEDKC
jgi:hypothetical protein